MENELIEKYKEIHKTSKELEHGLSNLNTNRGGSANGLKGFCAEHENTALDNFERINKGIRARGKVINNNGAADAVIEYGNGQYGRQIQYKYGYTTNYFKKKICSGKYDGMKLGVNPENPVLQNDEVRRMAKAHGIILSEGKMPEPKSKSLATCMRVEGKIRAGLKLKSANHAPGVAKVHATKNEVMAMCQITSTYVSEEVVRVGFNEAGMDVAIGSAKFAAVLSVTKNTLSVIRGDEDVSDAVKEVLIDTSSAFALAYATADVMDKLKLDHGEAALLVNGTIQISKQIIAYVKGEVDEGQLIENVAETTAYLVAVYAGKMIGGVIGSTAGPLGEMIGAYIGEIITTAVCSDVISTIKYNKEFDKQNSRIKSLYRNAECEIRNSQARLEQIIQKENEELRSAIRLGFENVLSGIQSNSYDQIERGVIVIGERFDLSAEDIRRDKVTRNTLFRNEEEIVLE